MILARLSRAIRVQNWFAVAIEFVIVAVGVAWLIIRVVLGMRGLNEAIGKLKDDYEVAVQNNPG